MIRVNLAVSPQQAADLIRGIQRGIFTIEDVPEEAREPQIVLISCPEIGWRAFAYAYDVITVEPRYLLALDLSRRVEARQIGTTTLRLFHLSNQMPEVHATVFCLRRIEYETNCDKLDAGQQLG